MIKAHWSRTFNSIKQYWEIKDQYREKKWGLIEKRRKTKFLPIFFHTIKHLKTKAIIERDKTRKLGIIIPKLD